MLENSDYTAVELSNKIIKEVTLFSQNYSQYDDITLVIFKFESKQSAKNGQDRQKISAIGGSAMAEN